MLHKKDGSRIGPIGCHLFSPLGKPEGFITKKSVPGFVFRVPGSKTGLPRQFVLRRLKGEDIRRGSGFGVKSLTEKTFKA